MLKNAFVCLLQYQKRLLVPVFARAVFAVDIHFKYKMLPTIGSLAGRTVFHNTLNGIVMCSAFTAIHTITTLAVTMKGGRALLTAHFVAACTVKDRAAVITEISLAYPTN
jgi:hypothetical protein